MSKIYSLYQYLKNEDSKIIYLFKSGIFYIAISEDATYLSNKFGFKLTRFNDNIQKCGFPIASVEKYTKLFEDNNVNFKLINSTSDNTSSSNKNNDDVKKLIDNISNVDPERLSVLEIYKYLDKIKQEAIKIKKTIF